MRSNRLPALTMACLGLLGAGFASAGTLQQVLTRGTLRVGITLAEPWALRDEAGEYRGFEIDVARKLATDMDVEIQFVRYDQEALIRALEAGEIDLIAAGFAVTPERALHANFSNPYATGGIGIATNTVSTADVENLEQLNAPEYTIAAVEDSVARDLAARILNRATIRTFRTETDAIEALVSGEVDVYLEQEPIPSFLALEYPRQVDVPVSQPLVSTPAAFAVTKGDPDFLAYLNAWIVARNADTWLPTMYRYWFKSLEWKN